MNGRHQQEEVCSRDTEFAGPAPSGQRKIIHFASGETLEEESSGEEGEPAANAPPFGEPAERTRFSFKNMAILVGRISLLTCDFFGERLAGALGLNAAKYQYAIDQHRSGREKPSSRATDELTEGRGEAAHFSRRLDGSRYGATGVADARGSRDEKFLPGQEGYHNRSYQADEDFF
ncbi:protein FAM177A1 isoform X2 [Scophthalmus maximus]|uniref:protein FAM177A1 isoform X2 n=1 Tax=Scophthalmus maximus TaxID=52904 RepID=UPI001FA8E115|nr:protein FAM177A1 isoform X2 [Scophthalmus maximus]